MDQIPNETLCQERVTVCDVQFRSGSKVYFFDPGQLMILPGMEVIVDTAHGQEFGRCTRGNHSVSASQVVQPLRQVIRIATQKDRKINDENRVLEKKAFELCRKKIEELGLDMILTSTEYTFDGSKVMFYFTADNRVDFRELVKILASVLHTRIELRQIGVRDKAKMVGGLGICGRPFCCGEFLEEFQPVSIKMAKTQNLSLNPTKISGTCGRLMCCLNYEQEAYEDLLRNSPKVESFVDTPDGRGTVTNVNLLRQSVNVRLEKQPDTIVCHKNCDICVLRSGKPKKTDEPIPEDLAPISGGKEKKREEELAFRTYLEPVVIRGEETAGEDSESRLKRRRKGGKPKAEPVEAELSQKAAPAEKQKPEKSEKKEKKNTQKLEKKDRKAEQKAEKPEKVEKVEKVEKTEKQEKAEKSKGGKKPEKLEKAEKLEKPENPESRAEKPGKQNAAGGEKRPERRDRSRGHKPRNEKTEKAEAAEKAEKPAQQPAEAGSPEGQEGAAHKSHHRRHRYYRNHKSSKKPEA